MTCRYHDRFLNGYVKDGRRTTRFNDFDRQSFLVMIRRGVDVRVYSNILVQKNVEYIFCLSVYALSEIYNCCSFLTVSPILYGIKKIE